MQKEKNLVKKSDEKIRVIIPAAGLGKRTGLSYPKCLFEVHDKPIIMHIIEKIIKIDSKPIIIINPNFEDEFSAVFEKYRIEVVYAYQPDPIGMGNAVLCSNHLLTNNETVLLIWSDVLNIRKKTIDKMVKLHLKNENDFTIASYIGENCYTIIERTKKGEIKKILETKALGISPAAYGEREIGLFIFKSKFIFKQLKKDALNSVYSNGKNEQGFLYLIEKLRKKMKIEAYVIAKEIETKSFNALSDLI